MAQNWIFRDSSHAEGVAATGFTSIAIPKPELTKNGDLIVICAMYDNAATAVIPPGFAHVSGSPIAQSTTYKSLLIWKIASNEPFFWTITRTGSGSFFASACVVYSKILASPGVVSASATASGTTVNAPTVTTTAADALVIRAVTTWTATAVAFAAGTTRVASVNVDNIVLIADQDKATTGATGTDTVTASPTGPLIAFTAAFNQSLTSLVHTVSGNGTIAVDSPKAVSLSLTGIAASTDQGKGLPLRYFGLGNITFANADGAHRNYYLEHASEIAVSPLDNPTTIYYSLKPGVTAVITELAST